MATAVIAPPFNAYAYRPADPGAWSASKVYTNTGQIVLQLGAQPPNRTGSIFAGATLLEYVTVDVAGQYFFTASVEVGPLTLLPRGHTVAAEIIMGLEGSQGDREEFRPPTPSGIIGARLGTFQLAFAANLAARVPYTLRAACGLLLEYSGTPNPLPYAEIIATYRSVARLSPPGGQESLAPQSFGAYEEAKTHEVDAGDAGSIDGITPKK